ncbi:MAG: hypothetical protein JW913_02065 [Chitinispirillaceae bacterium]|nr:hypothetical protein [Chitinispirillaceae bacterium]
MKQSAFHVLLLVVLIAQLDAAAVKQLTFSGSAIQCDGESNSIIVRKGKKEMSFFVVGKITRGGNKIYINDLKKGCPLVVTYQKNRKSFVAIRVEAEVCEK